MDNINTKGCRRKAAGQFKLLRKCGGSRIIAIGQYLPKDWCMVKIVPLTMPDASHFLAGKRGVGLYFEKVA